MRESMKRLLRSAAPVAVALIVTLVAAGCGKYSYSKLKARKAFRDATVQYTAQDWKRAADKFEEVVANDPEYVTAYFYLANSYDNMYKPARAGEPENDAYMQKAIEWYKKAAEKDTNPSQRELAMKFLVNAYGSEKLNNPAEAEPVVKQMIQMQPNEPANYFGLSKIYEDAGRYEEAEQALLKAKEIKPNDPQVYTTLSGFYNRQGEFDKTMEALHKAAELDPDNPQGYQLIATFYWEKAFKDKRLKPPQAREYILKGIEATDKALSLNPNYADALLYKNILLRLQANTETDRNRQQELLKQADELRERAIELNKKKPADTTPASGKPGAPPKTGR
jgi:tetratricopeptide (TPR) repeat protein